MKGTAHKWDSFKKEKIHIYEGAYFFIFYGNASHAILIAENPEIWEII